MKLVEVRQVLNAEVLCGEEWLDRNVSTVCGTNLLSDVLAFTKEKTLLVTGLTNIQVVRTAEIGDLVAIVFICGKCPAPVMLSMARAKGIPLMVSRYPLYEACSLLYKRGLKGCIAW